MQTNINAFTAMIFCEITFSSFKIAPDLWNRFIIHRWLEKFEKSSVTL